MRRRAAPLLAALALAGSTLAAPAPGSAAATPRHPPVVMLVFEEFSLIPLLDRSGHIDASRYPNFARLARGATFFRNFTAIGDATPPVTASLLSSQAYRLNTSSVASGHPRTLFTLLHRNGYGIDADEQPVALCGPKLCPGEPATLSQAEVGEALFGGQRLRRYRDWVASIRPHAKPTLYYEHSLLPHQPFEYFPDGRDYRTAAGQPPYALTQEMAQQDGWLVDSTWQRHLLQVALADRMLGELIQRLKAEGLYDRALLVVTADNGEDFGTVGHNGHVIDDETATAIASTPFFVRTPGQHAGRLADRHVDTFDVLPTIAGAAGLRVPWATRGRSAFAARPSAPDTVTLYRRTGGPLRIALPALIRRRAALVRARIARFARGMFGIGPAPSLIGRRVADLAPETSRRLHVTLDAPGRVRDVDPAAQSIPALVTGRLSGRGAHPGLPLAVAVNGRVVATGWDAQVPGRTLPEVAVLLPEDAYAPGRNAIEVLAMRVVGDQVRLVRAAG